MAFPVVEATASSTETTATINHSVALPAGIVSGELLLALVGGRQFFGNIPSGWSRPAFLSHSSNADVTDIQVLQRTADGSEGSTLSFTSSNSSKSAHSVLRISGWSSLEISTQAEGASTTPNSPLFTPSGGEDDYLWIPITGTQHTEVTAAPTDYSGLLSSFTGSSTGDAAIGAANRSLNASSENPGGFTQATDTRWVAATIAIAPTAGGLDLVRVINEEQRI